MAKAKKTIISNQLLAEIKEQVAARSYKITSANLVDGYCNYVFEITEGIGIGDKLTTKGTHVVKDDMRKAFVAMNVHLAYRDDIFKHAEVEIKNIGTMHGHELTTLYNVTGFIISGSDENESIILIGDKYVSGGDRFSLKSPKTLIDELSSYKWKDDLLQAAIIARNEVALYKEGKYIEDEEDVDQKEKAKQTTISFGGNGFEKDEADDMGDFENAAR